MDHRQLMRAVAATRILVGAALVALPGVAGSNWIGEPAHDRRVKVMIRAMGIRDLALGAGTLQALDSGEPAKSWILMSVVLDAVDFAATGLAIKSLGARRALPAMAVAATVAGGPARRREGRLNFSRTLSVRPRTRVEDPCVVPPTEGANVATVLTRRGRHQNGPLKPGGFRQSALPQSFKFHAN